MVTASAGQLLLAFLAAMGIPGAIMGLIVWRIKGRFEARAEDLAEKEQARQELILLLVQSTRASIALGEATAHAMQRGHTNGDTEAALAYATEVKHKQKDFLARQGIHALLD